MSDKFFSILNNFLPKHTINKASGLIAKILSVITGIAAFCFFSGAATFLILGILAFKPLLAFSIFFAVPAVILTIISYKLTGKYINFSNTQHKDLKECVKILKDVKNFLKSGNVEKKEADHIYRTMHDELKNVKLLSGKIDEAIKNMSSQDYDVVKLAKRINDLKGKEPIDESLIKRLYEQKENVLLVEEKIKKIREQISNVRLFFNSIYTKLTLISTVDNKDSFDAVETEIQKMLNFKLNVSKFSEELKIKT
jgi:DNA repair exonuclease SbcCD ATPase subunit